ncbi:MAG TPA: M14 family metallopeptidase [Haliscomenobacter sp.]|uniref:M14 family metallopeptidase n=1 Tax=Haliscomenobacter sp. TaxID=2717303 RepID=UPI002C5FB66A|nr:M14 family metallopeptidase [Haliscomenobacter sp.]HOY16518.1 M14 family metallopeptidase [Haliscomenobacter sp.]
MRLIVLLILGGFWSSLSAQKTYSTFPQLTTRIKDLASKNANLASVSSAGKSAGGKDLWLLTLSQGNPSSKPALLLVAGLDGSHPAGSETLLLMAEKMLNNPNDQVKDLLSKKTLYIIACANPDAWDVSKGKFERSGNATASDEDRDGRVNEDPFEDLNADGLITQIRIEDPSGTYIPSKTDPRILVKADPSKNELGKYLLISEGTDNDKDDNWNEDAEGGVNINKNFTYNYPYFEKETGVYAASEAETKAVLEVLYRNLNIFGVIVFGPENNLSTATKYDASKTRSRIVTGPLEKDAAVAETVSKLYNTSTGLKNAPAMPLGKGSLVQTAYYHAGRFGFGTPGWWPQLPPPDTSQKQKAPAAATLSGDEIFFKWADAEKVSVFVDWKEIKHPDFPGKKAEVGGLMPYARWNPPVSYLDDIATRHNRFVLDLAAAMPSLDLVNAKVETLQAGVNRITVQVINKGFLPTFADLGNRVKYVSKVRTTLNASATQAILSGKKTNLQPSLGAGELVEYTWLVNGTGKISVTVTCPTAGIKTVELTLN